jgi:hypothetical protein
MSLLSWVLGDRGKAELEQFASGLQQEVISRSEVEDEEQFRVNAFTEVMLEYLSDAGEVEGAVVCHHKARGEEVSAYALSEDGNFLELVVSLYTQSVPPRTVTKAEVDTAFKRLTEFLRRALKGAHGSIEESSPAFDMADSINKARENLSSVRLSLATDGKITDLKKQPEVIDGVSVSYHVWDIVRLHRFVSSGKQREPIEIDFKASFGEVIPCLSMPGNSEDYRAYLAIIRGDILAALYEEHGPRLLERNVRSFLQARGKVNKGIQQTINEQPRRFLAYNNGISVTAAEVRVERGKDGTAGIAWARDLQIVNGGQTTASIHHAARKEKADVSSVHVQAKISVITPELFEELVPLISRFANSQNKVNEADFSANKEFHIELEKLSRSVWTPPRPGTREQTHWFYERARGQYQDEKARQKTPGQKKAFSEWNPPNQKFTKTDVAKFENTWAALPHLVSYGAEKNFQMFASRIEDEHWGLPDLGYFENLVAKAILFRRAEKLVSAQDYGGYRANIVTYTLALIFNRTARRIDLKKIWAEQDISPALADLIASVSRLVHASITNPPSGRNVTEWCKKEACWTRMLDEVDFEIPKTVQKELIPLGKGGSTPAAASGRPVSPENQERMKAISDVSGDGWFALAHWAKQTESLTTWDRRFAFSMGTQVKRGKDLSVKQLGHAERILKEARRLGFSEEEPSRSGGD